jgi:hypothetical protein
MSLKNQLILQREKVYEKFSKKSENIKLPFRLDQSQQILICLPEQQNNFSKKELAQDYQNLFKGLSTQFCAPSDLASEIPNTVNCLYYEKDSFPVLKKLPELLKKVLNAKSYQMALDLNVDFSLYAALICKMTNAPVRISFNKPNAGLFFNFLVSTKDKDISYKESLPIIKKQLRSMLL